MVFADVLLATLFVGLAVIVLLASYLLHLQRTMAVSSPVSSYEKEDTLSGQAEDPPWTVVDARGKPNRKNHPLYKKVAVISGEVNALSPAEVRQRVGALRLSKRGVDTVLCKRLKAYLRREAVLGDRTAPGDLLSSVQSNPYGLDYLLVLDFEATCEIQNPPDYIHEIIEFPVVLLNLKNLQVEDEFRSYCRPLINPVLTDFCKRLTGIRQDQVSTAPYFSEVFQMFNEWLEAKELGTTYKFAVVTDCPWDIKECLFPQCVLARVPFPGYATKWLDMRKLFASFYQMKSGNLAKMLENLGMKFEGREHCGMDDARNIVRILLQMIEDGCVLKYNRFMPEDALRDFAVKGKR